MPVVLGNPRTGNWGQIPSDSTIFENDVCRIQVHVPFWFLPAVGGLLIEAFLSQFYLNQFRDLLAAHLDIPNENIYYISMLPTPHGNTGNYDILITAEFIYKSSPVAPIVVVYIVIGVVAVLFIVEVSLGNFSLWRIITGDQNPKTTAESPLGALLVIALLFVIAIVAFGALRRK